MKLFRSVFIAVILAVLFINPALGKKAQSERVAILRSEIYLYILVMAGWQQTPQSYEDEIVNLEFVLNKAGFDYDIISEEDIINNKIDQYGALYAIDTLCIKQETEEAIKSYVNRGGLFVAIGDFGRNVDYSFKIEWNFADLFGLKSLVADKWLGSVSQDSKLFQQASLKDKSTSLTKGAPDKVVFGPGTESAWVCVPDGAVAVATFPKFLSAAYQRSEMIDKEIIAISLNKYGRGHAIFISALPGGRTKEVLLHNQTIQQILGNTRNYLGKAVREQKSLKPVYYFTASQMGYLPEEPKSVILRIAHSKEKPVKAVYQIIDKRTGQSRYKGILKSISCYKWPDIYLKGDFSDFSLSGEYLIKATVSFQNRQEELQTYSFSITPELYSITFPIQLQYLRKLAVGIDYFKDDPVPGGFIDATGDSSVWMWAMPHVVYCLAELYANLPAGEQKDKAYFLLDHGADWCLRMQREDGDVNSGISPGFQVHILHLRPWEDKTARKLFYWKSFNYLSTYTAAMARASRTCKKKDTALKYKKAAVKAYKAFSLYQIETTEDLGNAVWAAVELYKTAGNESFLKDAETWAERQIKRQILDEDFTSDHIYGMFNKTDNLSEICFTQQSKMFHNLGIYMGLLELLNSTKNKQLKKSITRCLDIFMTHYLKKISFLSPYGQIAYGLVKTESGYEPFYFPTVASGSIHALNCDLTAMALFSLKYSIFKKDKTFYDIASRQLQWIMGQNPLNYCMITGLGSLNPPLMGKDYALGEIPGGMPNGINGGLTDRPTWGNAPDSREYWLPQTVYFLAAGSLMEKTRKIFKK